MSGFRFGSAQSLASGSAPGPGAVSVPAAGSGFSLGGAPASNAVPGGVFGFGGAPSAPAPSTTPVPSTTVTTAGTSVANGTSQVPGAATGSTTEAKAEMVVPPFESSFPFLALHARLRDRPSRLLDPSSYSSSGYGITSAVFEGQELIQMLKCVSASGNDGSDGAILSDPTPIVFATPSSNEQRQKLKSNPRVELFGNVVPVTPSMLDEIFSLADDLRLDLIDALALYAGASDVGTRKWLEQSAGVSGGLLDAAAATAEASLEEAKRRIQPPSQSKDPNAMEGVQLTPGASDPLNQKSHFRSHTRDPLEPLNLGDDVPRAARELYFRERSCLLSTLLGLVKSRISAMEMLRQANEHFDDFGDTNGGKYILEATDQLLEAGLITNLVLCIRDLTAKITSLGREIATGIEKQVEMAKKGNSNASATSTGFPNNGLAPATPPKKSQSVTASIHALLAFAHDQRQIASECLFYLAYHTQLKGSEIASIVRLIRDLTNGEQTNSAVAATAEGIGCGLPLLDPLRDVPTGFVFEGDAAQQSVSLQPPPTAHSSPFVWGGSQQQQHFGSATRRKKNKERKQWDDELIQSVWGFHPARPQNENDGNKAGGGMAQLLRCVGTLVMGVLCSLDANNLLIDRERHRPNTFGVGNALFPPQSTSPDDLPSTSSLDPVHACLCPSADAHSTWKRTDIFGLLCGSYGLLLRHVASSLLSPRGATGARQSSPDKAFLFSPGANQHRGGGGSNIDLRSTFRSCLEIPTMAKSLTFARTSLLPSFGFPCMKSNDSARGNSSSVKSSASAFDADFNFYTSVLAEFSSQYLDAICVFGELPLSRAQWQSDEEKELQLRHAQEQQRRQFGAWSGHQEDNREIPTDVDLTKRPDCMDDVVALAVAVCVAHPESSAHFWSTAEAMPVLHSAAAPDPLCLVPSRAMKKLDRLRMEDQTLLGSFLSLLGVLALAPSPIINNQCDGPPINGADAVHNYLSFSLRLDISTPPSPSRNELGHDIDWPFLLHAIQWYTKELKPAKGPMPVFGRGSSIANSKNDASGQLDNVPSTAYYYGTEDNDSGISSRQPATDSGTGFPISTSGGSTGVSSDKAGVSVKKELDETNIVILLSILGVISNVASMSEKARDEILAIQMRPIEGEASSSQSSEDALKILFALVEMPLPPDISGSILVAIANLIGGRGNRSSTRTPQQLKKDEDIARRGWELLEHSQLLPIDLLAQYGPFTEDGASAYFGVMASSSLAVSPDPSQTPWFRPFEKHGILHCMEHIESKDGRYPSTEGFLYLISTLVFAVGCPSDLGAQWRPRPGCAPYVEFVTNFVLPRALGTKKDDAGLYFANSADECRLLCRALEVVDAVLTRYFVPPPKLTSNLVAELSNAKSKDLSSSLQIKPSDRTEYKSHVKSNTKAASKQRGLSTISSKIFQTPDDISHFDLQDSVLDYVDLPATVVLPGHIADVAAGQRDQRNNNTFGVAVERSSAELATPSMPRAKSPGFSLLTDILSMAESSLFKVICSIILLRGDVVGISTICGTRAYSKMLCDALFGNSEPNFEVVRGGLDLSRLPLTVVYSMMKPLKPPAVGAIVQSMGPSGPLLFVSNDDAVYWRERSILLSLRALCASAGREDSLCRTLETNSTPLNVISVLRFKSSLRRSTAVSSLESRVVNISHLSELLRTHTPSSKELLPAISQFVGYESCMLLGEDEISKTAMGLVAYIVKTLPQHESISSLCGTKSVGKDRLADALARRLLRSSRIMSQNEDEDVRAVILNLLLSNLGFSSRGETSLSLLLLGLSDSEVLSSMKALNEQRSKHTLHAGNSGSGNCFDAVINLLWDVDFVLRPESAQLATKCFELIYRLCMYTSSSSISFAAASGAKLFVLSKLRKIEFWAIHAKRFLGVANLQSQSLLGSLVANIQFGSAESDHLNYILHSISWFLKGIAVELFCLMGLDSASLPPNSIEFANFISSTSQKPTQCRKLLNLLFSSPQPYLLNALMDLPLMKPPIGEILGGAAPPRDMVQASSRPMEGPTEIFSEFMQIDIGLLSKSINKLKGKDLLFQPNEEGEKDALRWAEGWNSFVAYSCASSHLSNAWGIVMCTAFLFCQSILFEPQQIGFDDRDEPILDSNTTIEILFAILTRLSSTEAESVEVVRRNSSHSEFGHGFSLDAGSAISLGITALRTIEVVLEWRKDSTKEPVSKHSGEPPKSPSIWKEHISKMCVMLADAIGSWSRDQGPKDPWREELVATLSCTLAKLLNSSDPGSLDIAEQNFGVFRRAAHYLACLGGDLKSNGISAEGESLNSAGSTTSYSFAARSGLCAIIVHFENSMRNVGSGEPESFLTKVFDHGQFKENMGERGISGMIKRLVLFDTGIATVLESIACSRSGTDLLVSNGILEALIESARKYSEEESKMVPQEETASQSFVMERETYGARSIRPPSFLHGHISLLNSMLATQCSHNGALLRRVSMDAGRVLVLLARTGERLFRFFPRDAALATKFVTCLYLTSRGLLRSSHANVIRSIDANGLESVRIFGLVDVFGDAVLPMFDRRIADLASHLSEYPFPRNLLPSLPAKIAIIERAILSRKIHAPAGVEDVRCWWDMIQSSNEKGSVNVGTPLPEPPTSLRHNYDRERSWSDEKYAYATTAAACLESCLLYAKARASGPLDLRSYIIDGLSVCRGLCRCSDAAKAIEIRINETGGTDEIELAQVMGVSMSIGDKASHMSLILEMQRIEREALILLGPKLGRCAYYLLMISSAMVEILRRSAAENFSKVPSHVSQEITEFASALLPTLQHTQIESRGIGCMEMSSSTEMNDKSKSIAKKIREELEHLTTSMF